MNSEIRTEITIGFDVDPNWNFETHAAHLFQAQTIMERFMGDKADYGMEIIHKPDGTEHHQFSFNIVGKEK
ncbi:MAG: hypothetical protein LUC30_01240 [Clostridiales bacterium]|nr:hypothetical protein [Clostridiales bacterium]